MEKVFILAVLVTVIHGPAYSQMVKSCAQKPCILTAICREVLNRTSGEISAECLDSLRYPPTGNEDKCSNGQPLWAVSSTGGCSEASCGRVVDRITCPGGYRCVIAPNDAYSLCCPDNVKSGECPVHKPGSVGICADMCQTDRNCAGDLKCCPNPCGALTCQSPVRFSNRTCQTTECVSGYVCQDTPSGPQCVYAIREGKCPARPVFKPSTPCSKCKSDLDCPDYQKCCPWRRLTCRQCLDPEPSWTCKNITCPEGQSCVMKEVICIKAPCFPVPTCV